MQPPGLLPTSEMGCNLERWQLLWPLYWRVTGIKTEKKISKQFRSISENLVKMFWYGTILFIFFGSFFLIQSTIPNTYPKVGKIFFSAFWCDKTWILLLSRFWYSYEPTVGVSAPFWALDEMRAPWVLVAISCCPPSEDEALSSYSNPELSLLTQMCCLRPWIWSLRLFWKSRFDYSLNSES